MVQNWSTVHKLHGQLVQMVLELGLRRMSKVNKQEKQTIQREMEKDIAYLENNVKLLVTGAYVHVGKKEEI